MHHAHRTVAALVLGLTLFAEVLPTGITFAVPAAEYTDVQESAWYSDSVQEFSARGILSADEATFRPTENATRAELVQLILATKGSVATAHEGASEFSDVESGAWYFDAFHQAAAEGWLRGDANCYGSLPCTVRPLSTITRAEVAAMFTTAFGYRPLNLAPAFDDTPERAWYFSALQSLADRCILRGDDNSSGLFVRPASPVNRAEMIVMLSRADKNLRYGSDCGADLRPAAVPALSADTGSMVTDFGAARDGQVLMFKNGVVSWQDISTISALIDTFQTRSGSGRRPSSGGSSQERRYGGGGGGSTTTTSSSAGDLTRATADGLYVNISGDTMNGALAITYDGLGLNISGTASGQVLHAERLLTVSGSAVFDGNITIRGVTYTFPAGDGAGSGKVLKTNGAGQLSWSDDNATGTGLSQASADARYVNQSGDTMTGSLLVQATMSGRHLIVSQTASFSGALVAAGNATVKGTLSGSRLVVSGHTNISGTLLVLGGVTSKLTVSGSNLYASSSVSGAHLYARTTFNGAGLADCDTAGTSKLLWDATTKRFSCGTDTDTNTTYTAGQGLTLNGTAFRLSDSFSGTALSVFGTMSGYNLTVSRSASISGTLIVKTGITSKGSVSGSTIDGFGLGSCNGASQKLLYNATTDKFECGTISASSSSFSTGNVLTIGDARYVNQSGDTMTGSLLVQATLSGRHLIVSQTASFSGALIAATTATVKGTLSGSRLVVSGHANISGTLLVLNGITSKSTISGANLYAAASISGVHLYARTTFNGAGLADCDTAGTSKLLWDATTKRFSCGTDTDTNTTYTAGQGLSLNGTAFSLSSSFSGTSLKIFGTLTGNILHAEKTLTSSGALVWEGAASGATLYVATSINGAGLTDCDLATQTLAWDATTGRFSCGTDSDTTYTAGQGLTLNGTAFRLSDAFSGTSLSVYGTMSGRHLTVSQTASISGALVAKTSATVLGTLSGSRLVVSGHANISGTLLVLNGITSKSTISGANLYAAASISGVHLYARTTFNGAGLADCDVAGTSKLLWDASTKRFSCGTDTDTNTTYVAGQGLTLNGTTFRMNDALTGSALTIYGTISGSNLTISRSASISGTLLVKTSITSKGSVSGSTIGGFGLGSCNGVNQKLLFNTTSGKFECSVDQTAGSGLAQSDADARYVNQSGDTMTGSLLVQATMSGRHLIVSQTASFSGALVAAGNATVKGTLSGSRLVVSGHTNISGTLLVLNGITSKSTVSGANLYAAASISGVHLYARTTFNGAGLADCDTAGTSKLLWDATTKRFSCGTDTDTNTTYTAGQGLSLNGTAFSLSSSFSGTSLKIFGTLTGNILHAEKTLTSSGTLVWEGAASGATLYVATSINGAGLTDCDLATQTLAWDATTGRFSCGTDSDTTYVAGQGLTLNGTTFRMNDALTGTSLIVSGTMSGRHLTVSQTASISGALVAKTSATVLGTLSGSRLVVSGHTNISGTLLVLNGITSKTTISGANLYAAASISGVHLYARTTFNGAGLADCDTAGTSKLLWDSATKRFSCGTDQNAGTFGTGNVLTIGDARYVNQSGDTMTGALTIDLTTGNFNTIGLKIIETASGAHLHAERTLTSSGGLVWEGAASGATLYVATSINGAGLTDCDLATQTLAWDATTGRFSCGTDSDTTYTAGQGLSLNGTAFSLSSSFSGTSLKIFGTLTGNILHAEKTLTSSGTLVWEGAASGATLYVATSINGAGLTDCDLATQTLAWDATTGRFSCGTDSDTTYTAGQGLTLNGTAFRLSDAFSGTSLSVYGTMSGYNLTVSRSASISGTLIVKTGITSKGSVSGSTIDGFGLGTCTGSTQKLMYNATTDKFECGTIAVSTTFSTGNVITIGDARYVNQSGDTMTGSLLVQATLSGRHLIVSQTASFSGALVAAGNATVKGTLSGSRLVVSGHTNISGTLLVLNGITSKSTVSGANLYAASSVSGVHLYARTTFNGAGLADCDTAGTSKLMWDSATKRFSCGTDQNAGTFGTGNVLTIGDDRYVRTAGDTMTGALILDLTSGHLGLRIIEMASGSVIHAEKTLTASGMIKVTQQTIQGSGALVVHQLRNSSGAYIRNDGRNVPVLVLENSSGSTMTGAARAPHILFGYRGNFDVRLYRSTGAVLSLSGHFLPGLSNKFDLGSSAYRWRDLYLSGGTIRMGSPGDEATLRYNSSANRFGIDVNTDGTEEFSLLSTGFVGIGTANPKTQLDVQGTISGTHLTISKSATISGSLVVVGTQIQTRGTFSGYNLTVSRSASISGTLLVKTSITSKGSISGSTIAGFNLGSCNGASQKLLYNYSTQKFECGTDVDTDTNTTYVAGQGLTLNGTTFRMNDALTGTSLIVSGTMSGRHLVVSQTASVSGTLVVLGSITSKSTVSGANLYAAASISGVHLYARTTFNGAGLADCDTAGTSKLLWDSSTKRFSCGTDQNAGTFGTGNVLTIGDARYVNQSGDTMTGALTIDLTTGNFNTIGLKIIETASGAHLHAERTLTSSGTLVWEGAASGATLYVATSINGAGLTDCDAASSKLTWDATTGRFICGTDTDTNTTYTAGQGLSLNGTAFSLSSSFSGTSLKIFGTLTGNILHAEKTLTSSGTLVWEGAASGATLYVATSINGAGLTDCDAASSKLTWDATTGRFICGTDTDTNTTYTAGQGLSLNGTAFSLSSSFSGTSLKIFGTLTGNILHAEKTLTSSGTLVWEGAASGATLYIATSINGAGLTDCDLATQTLAWDATTGRFSCGTDSDTTYVAGQGLTLNGTTFRMNDALTGSSLSIYGTMSGYNLTVSRSASISGTLIVKTGITSKGSVSGSTIDGFGLGSCNGASQKLLYNATTDKFECGTISAAGTFSTGNVLTIGDARYVNQSGDTMTGSLLVQATLSGRHLIVSQTASFSGALVAAGNATVKGTLSGSRLVVSGHTNISGTLLVLNGITSKTTISGANLYAAASISGVHLYARTTFNGAGLADCDTAGTSKLLWDSSTKRFSCGTDQNAGTFGTGNVLTIGDARYVNQSGDTMTGSLLVQATLSGRHLIVSQTASFSGALTAAGNATVKGTLSGSRLVVSGHTNISGTLLVLNGITSKTTISGANLYAAASISGVHLYARTTFNGAGLADCDTAGTSKLLWDSATKRFSCGTDQNAGTFGTGNVLTIGDARYVNQSGDTMTGALTIDLTTGNFNTIGLKIIETASGAHLHAERTLTSSGTLVWEGDASGATLYVATSISGAGLADCDIAGTSKLLWDATTKRFSCGTDTDTDTNTTYTAGQGLSLNGTAFRLSDAFSGTSLSVYGTMSGYNLTVSRSASISGTLIVKTGITSKGSLSGATIAGFNLGSCNGSTQKILYNYSTQKFECGSDLNTGGGFSTGNVLTIGDARYVNQSGDTMTGALTIDLTTGNFNTVGLKIIETASGAHLHAERTLTSSGGLVWEGDASGATLYVATSISGAGLTDCDIAGTSKLLWDATTKRFSCGTDTDTNTTYVAGQGLTLNGTAFRMNDALTGSSLKVFGTMSGYNLTVSRNASISGALVVTGDTTVKGTLSGAAVVSMSQVRVGETAADIYSTLGKNSLNFYRASQPSYINQNGIGGSLYFRVSNASELDTNAIVVLSSGNVGMGGNTAPETSLDVIGTVSGSRLVVSGDMQASGSLIVRSAIVSRGSVSGSTIAGFNLGSCNGSTQKILYNYSTQKFECGTDLNTGGSSSFSTGNVLTIGDARYVNQSGDTMTGALTIDLTTGNFNTVGLKIIETASGAHLHAERTLSSSGTIVTESGANIDAGLIYANAVNDMVGIGTTSPKAKLDVAGTLSGTHLSISRTASISGALSLLGDITVKKNTAPEITLNLANDTATVQPLMTFQRSRGTQSSKTTVVQNSLLGAIRFMGFDGSTNIQGARIEAKVDDTPGAADMPTALFFYTTRNATMTGVVAMKITQNQQVGIGSGASSVSSAATDAALQLMGDGGDSFIRFSDGDTNFAMGLEEATNELRISTTQYDNSPALEMETGGMVGLVTSTNQDASAKLHIFSPSGTTGLKIMSVQGWNTADALQILGNNSTTIQTLLTHSGGAVFNEAGGSKGSFRIEGDTNANLLYGDYTNDRIGIGTASPKVLFDVLGAMSGSRLTISRQASMSGALSVLGDVSTRKTLSGQLLHAERDLTSSGLTVLVQKHSIRGSGAVVVKQFRNSTGVYITSDASGAPLLVLEYNGSSNTDNTGTGGHVRPSILFGYKGTFDVRLWRSKNSNLNMSGTLNLRAGTGRTLLNLISDSTSAQTDVFRIESEVNTGLGTTHHNLVYRITASGAVHSDSRYNSAGADYAEWFYTPDKDLVSGELVCVDILKNNTVRRCLRDADPNVMGIVSTKPAFVGNAIGGADGIIPPGYVLVGLIGQVPAKVMIEGGEAIRPGDSLTPASVPGFARKAKAGESTVGVALEGYDGRGPNVVNVLISRRNQSLTVETVEQKVLDSIAAMNLSDEIQQMVQSVSQNLNLDDRVSTALNLHLQSIDLSEQVASAVDLYLSGAALSAENLSPEQIELIAAAVHALSTQSGSTGTSANDDVLAALSDRLLVLETALSGSVLHGAAGDFAVGGKLTIGSGMTLVQGDADIGPISVRGSEVSIGSLMATGSLRVVGPITIEGLATFLGDLRIEGELILSSKQAGFAVIPRTGTSVTIRWDDPMTGTPVVTATPDVPVLYAVSKVSATGFTIRIAGTAAEDITFAYIALSAESPGTVMGTGAVATGEEVPFNVDADGRPYSLTNSVWNECILDPFVFDICNGFHQDTTWFMHPDQVADGYEAESFTYDPEVGPTSLVLPPHFVKTVVTPAEEESEPAAQAEASDGAAAEEGTDGTDTATSGETETDTSDSSLPVTESDGEEALPQEESATDETADGVSQDASGEEPVAESADPAPAPTESTGS